MHDLLKSYRTRRLVTLRIIILDLLLTAQSSLPSERAATSARPAGTELTMASYETLPVTEEQALQKPKSYKKIVAGVALAAFVLGALSATVVKTSWHGNTALSSSQNRQHIALGETGKCLDIPGNNASFCLSSSALAVQSRRGLGIVIGEMLRSARSARWTPRARLARAVKFCPRAD